MNRWQERFDLIGDLHGRFDKLERLMERLGYRRERADKGGGVSFIPPAGHRAIFLGDLIDPKCGYRVAGGVRHTLQAVKTMVQRGDAICLMGNHEFNAACYHATGADGTPLRPHDAKNQAMHQGTLAEFTDWQHPGGEWLSVWLPWIKSLPFFLDAGGLRAVHASWHPRHLEVLRQANRSLAEDDFLQVCANEATREGAAIEACLKGIRATLPIGHEFADGAGVSRDKIRVRWWTSPELGCRCRDLVFPENPEIADMPPRGDLAELFAPYPEAAVPVFFGHYAKPGDARWNPEAPNVACLDYSGASDGPLLAYRWSGESRIQVGNYLSHC